MRKGSRATLKTDHLSCFAIWTFFIILFLKTLLYFNSHIIYTRDSKFMWHKRTCTEKTPFPSLCPTPATQVPSSWGTMILPEIICLLLILLLHMCCNLTHTVYFRLFQHPHFSSVQSLSPTLCNPMDCSIPGFPVHHQLPEFTQTHVH